MSKKVIVTGATGFIGSNLCRRLLDQDYKVYVILKSESKYDNIDDIKDNLTIFTYNQVLEDLVSFFTTVKADVVFHLASLFIAEHHEKDINALVDSNIRFGLQILEAMRLSETKQLINTGTSWQHYNGQNYNPVCLYAATKQAFEALIEYYVKAEKLKVITLKLFDTYGETDKRPKLINLLNKFADENKHLEMSFGMQKLDLLHVDDVVNGFITASNQFKGLNEHKRYALSSKRELSLRDVISIFEEVSGKKINISWGKRPYRKREVMDLWNTFDILPNWEPKISFEEGIKRKIRLKN